MKSTKGSLSENAHMYIMAVTLLVTFVGWGVQLTKPSPKSPPSWFGYVPMSIQPANSIGNPVQEMPSTFAITDFHNINA